MAGRIRQANEAWEALYRAQATIGRELAQAEVWSQVSFSEYGVLYALSTAPDGRRITELSNDVLLTQPGMSRLIGRLTTAGLVEREDDPADGRACRVRLTEAGRRVQREVGRRHARHVAQAMSRALSQQQLRQLRELCRPLAGPSEAEGGS